MGGEVAASVFGMAAEAMFGIVAGSMGGEVAVPAFGIVAGNAFGIVAGIEPSFSLELRARASPRLQENTCVCEHGDEVVSVSSECACSVAAHGYSRA
jgi:hypothetical protein